MSYFFDRPEPRPKREIFLFARMRTAIEFADGAIQALAKVCPFKTHLLEIGCDHVVWGNGFALRFTTFYGEGPKELCHSMETGLRELEAWAMHDGRGEHAESDRGGPFTRYFDVMPNQTDEISQIFIMGNPNSPKYQDRLDIVRSRLKGTCLPVFYFKDGQIIFLNTRESGSITNQRCGPEIRHFDEWFTLDSRGEIFSPEGLVKSGWHWILLSELTFSDDD